MSFVADLLGMATTLFIFGLMVANVLKTFQVATEVREIKEAIQELRRNAQNATRPQAGLSNFNAMPQNSPSPEELVRAVNAQSFTDELPR